jgi:hypothetical protein
MEPGHPTIPVTPPYPGHPPPPRNPLLIPLVVACAFAVLVVLAGAVFITVQMRDDDPTGLGVAAAPAGDRCVVGSWTAATSRTRTSEQVNGVTMTVTYTARGVRVRLDADGRGVTDYGNGVTFSAPGVADQEMAGTIHYRYSASHGRMTFSDVTSDATVTVRGAFGTSYSARMEPIAGAVSYTCGARTLAVTNDSYSHDLRAS